MARGSLVLRAGEPLGPARIGSLAAIGRTAVDVFQRPSIAILSTGNEITQPGEPLRPGHVYDVNRFTIDAVARRHGAATTLMPSAGDTRAELLVALERAAAHDVIVFSGGSSVGERDLVVQALEGRAEILFHGIAIKPGKPTLLARLGRAVFFGMPGNPTSCLTNAYLLLVPLVRRMARLPDWEPMTITAPLARPIRSSADRHQFYSVRIVDGRVEPAFKSSGDITSLASADGFIEIAASAGGLEAGDIVTVKLL
jgi:molybdenum cofactor synthesis domain-containing protein